jgi:EpsI family protein
MEKRMSPLGFLSSRAIQVATAILALQGFLLFAVARPEIVPSAPPLSGFPTRFAGWTLLQEGYVDEETRSVLQADDLLTRIYSRSTDNAPTNLFIAAFRSQRTGKSPHSPKNCLPGSGWVQSSSGTQTIDVPNEGPIEVNRYIVSRGDARSVVMYWYQSRYRVVADEFRAKAYVVLDSMRYNRSDTALVRVVTPVVNRNDNEAVKTATQFIADVFPNLREALPQ